MPEALTDNFQIARPDLNERTSHSRINTFKECKSFYRWRYIEKVPTVGTEEYFLLGTAYHKGMEVLYGHPNVATMPEDEVKQIVRMGIDEEWIDYFSKQNIIDLIDDFLTFEQDAGPALDYLNWRCSPECTDPDLWIRKPDGSLYTAPAMSNKYKTEYAKLNIDSRKESLDARARTLSAELAVSPHVSLCDAFVESYRLGRKHTRLSGIVQIVGVEKSFTQIKDGQYVDLVQLLPDMPPLQGFIDLMLELDGHGLTIMDHKTSKVECSFLDVLYHEQLNLYVHAVKVAFGLEVKAIGINNARFNTKVVVPVDWTIVNRIVERKKQEQRDIAAEVEFIPQDPVNKYAAKPCLGRSKPPYTGDNLKALCPFLEMCHPDVFAMLKQMNTTPEETAEQQAIAEAEQIEQTVVAEAQAAPPSAVERQLLQALGMEYMLEP